MSPEKSSIVDYAKSDASITSDIFMPSNKEKEVVTGIFHKFRISADDRNRNFQYFDGDNLIQYIEDSVRRFVTNIDEREDLEDWQARIHDPFTRNKVLAILGKVIQVLPLAQFASRGDEDFMKGMILTNLYEYSEEVDDYEELMINVILECIVKGTAIGYEGLERKEKLVKNVFKYDDKLTFKERKEITSRLYGSVIPLEDFYPSHVGARNIKQMPFCFWRTVIPFEKFKMDFSMYAKCGRVLPKTPHLNTDGERPFYLDHISDNVPMGSVEIIRYYDKDIDEYVIMANGVWLNPITHGESEEYVSPLPFNHKELPFWDIKYDIFGADFFYGKSLPDKLKSLQDVLNVLENMLLDQSFLTIFPPLLTNGFDSIEDDYLRPGRRTPIDTQGLPIDQAFMKLDVGTPTGWHQYILEYTRKIMEQSSLDQVSSGSAGVGGRTTAQEIRLAADGVASMLGVFARLINYGIKRKALLRGANILQFWTDKDVPMVQRVLGEEGPDKFNKAFNVFKLDGAVLTSGKRGTKVIEMYGNSADVPTRDETKARAQIQELRSGKKIEIVTIEAEYIREFMFDIKLIANPKTETTKDMEKAIQLEKVKTYISFFPNLINMEELAAQTCEKLGDDPTKILKDEVFNPAPQENPNAIPPTSTDPSANTSDNMVRGMKGGEMDAMQMRDLQNSMTG